MRRASGILVALLLAAGLAGCQAHPVPLSAQKGSTIIIPLGTEGFSDFGYGGTDYADPQRGTMVYQLEGTDPVVELTTRFTVAVPPHPASVKAQHGDTSTTLSQLLSVVDLVSSNGTEVPVGTHDLEVFRRLDGVDDPHPDGQYGGTIKILPQTIAVDGPNGPEDIVGTPTPKTVLNCDSTNCPDWLVSPKQLVPRPRIQMLLRPTPPGDGNEPPIAAFELDLKYPAGVIDVVEATQAAKVELPPNVRSMVWLEDDDAGTATISALPHPEAGGLSLWPLDVVFRLVDNAAPLDLDAHLADGTLKVTPIKAYDIDGQEISNPHVSAIRIR